ncbi:MAG: ATP-binding cassette domain-containing protein [Luteitalea sp.]|nr:ATP-binding cassette domain-containing protein [Luteitalea sp.]
MLQATGVSFSYRETLVVSDVSVRVGPGRVLGILGPNGAGKSTLLKLLAGILRPTAGVITLDGAPLASYSRRSLARRLAVVPQETHPAFDFSVLELALMGRYPHLDAFELEGMEDVALARAALETTGTAHLEGRAFATLSGGEKQRVVIASALAQLGNRESGIRNRGFELLLLDEPTSSLDLHYQLEIAALLVRLNRERGTTLVVTTHDLSFAASVCQELVLLRDARVLGHGPTEEVLTADNVRALYGVEVDVQYHAAAGHLTVVPLALNRP